MTGIMIGVGIGSGRGATLSPQVAQFLARVVPQDATHKAAYIGFINGMVAAGLFSGMDAFYIFKANEQATSLTNLISANYNCLVVGAPTFAANVGWTGVGTMTDYLNTQFGPSLAGTPNFAQNSNSLGAAISVASKAVSQFAIGQAGTIQSYIQPYFAGDTLTYWRAQSADLSVASPATLPGIWTGSRTGVNTLNLYQDNTVRMSSAAASAALTVGLIRILAGGDTSTMTIRAAWIGRGLSAGEVNTINSLLTTFFP